MAAAEEVKLTLRIHLGAGSRSLEPYVVELRNSSGESIRMANAMSGDKVHFKHLKPDIYRACLHGISGSKQCTSMDLFPPQESKSCGFTVDVAGPSLALNSTSQHTVKIEQLHTPDKARQELLHSLQAAVRGDLQEEITHLQRAIEIYPTYVEALNNLGYCYHLAGNQALSVRYLTRATELDPDSYTGWTNLAGDLLSLGQSEEALKAALHGLTLRPDSASSNFLTAYCYYQMQRYSEAEKYFTKVLDLDPAACTFPMLFLARISLFNHLKEDAEASIRIFLRLHPNHPEAAYWSEQLQNLETGNVNKEPVSVSHTARQ
jgi:tetratricopeptide (TPR) repeat protein